MSVTRGQCDARPTVACPADRHQYDQCLLVGAKLYCLVTEATLVRLCYITLRLCPASWLFCVWQSVPLQAINWKAFSDVLIGTFV